MVSPTARVSLSTSAGERKDIVRLTQKTLESNGKTGIIALKRKKRFQKIRKCQRHSKLKTDKMAKEQSALDMEGGLKLKIPLTEDK